MELIVVLIAMVTIMLLGLPVAFAIGSAAILYLVLGGVDLSVLPTRMVGQMTSIPLLAVPFFVLAGDLMNVGGVTQRIFAFARSLVGHVPGSLGHANVVASVAFAGMSGSAVADAAGLGRVQLDAMRRANYPDDFSLGVTVASSTIGPIVPPSINMVIYGALTGTSIGALFVGGILPGLTLAALLMCFVAIIAHRRGLPRDSRSTAREIGRAAMTALLPLFTPIIILGGILLGFTTPTEAAILAVFYGGFLGIFVYREVSLSVLIRVILRSTILSAALMLVIGCAAPFAHALIRGRVPQQLGESLFSVSDDIIVIWFLLLLAFAIVGMFMEVVAALIVLAPIVHPAMLLLGADPVHVGVVMVFGLGIGLVTPPVGLCLFVGSQISGRSVEFVTKGALPFLLPIFTALIALILFPGIVTWLPGLVLR